MLIPLAIIFAFFVTADQISKFIAVKSLGFVGNTAKFIPKFIRFEYRQNSGMAWGLFPNSRWVFVIVTVIVAAIIVYGIIKYRKIMPKFIAVTLTLILSGAVGNFIDRIFLGYVRDFIAFDFYDFPVFNIADTCVTIGSALLFIAILFTKEGRKFFGFANEKKRRAEAAAYEGAKKSEMAERASKAAQAVEADEIKSCEINSEGADSADETNEIPETNLSAETGEANKANARIETENRGNKTDE